MALQGEYLGMRLAVDDIDTENLGYFERCGAHNFSLQECTECHLLRYPPTTTCPTSTTLRICAKAWASRSPACA